jgi:hypothetical protein
MKQWRIFLLLFLSSCSYAAVNNMNTPPQQDTNAVQITTHNGMGFDNNAVMNPNASVTSVPQPPAKQTLGTATVSDTQIMTTIQSRITQDKNLAGSNIQVTCRFGIVTLEGSTDSLAKASEAESIAKLVNGVKGTTSKIKVNTNAAVTQSGQQVQ